jgi:hypothetical protein
MIQTTPARKLRGVFFAKAKINHGIGSAEIMSSGASRQFVNKTVII